MESDNNSLASSNFCKNLIVTSDLSKLNKEKLVDYAIETSNKIKENVMHIQKDVQKVQNMINH